MLASMDRIEVAECFPFVFPQEFAQTIANDKEVQYNLTQAPFFSSTLASLNIDPSAARDYTLVGAVALEEAGVFKIQIVMNVSVGYIPKVQQPASLARRRLLEHPAAVSSAAPSFEAGWLADIDSTELGGPRLGAAVRRVARTAGRMDRLFADFEASFQAAVLPGHSADEPADLSPGSPQPSGRRLLQDDCDFEYDAATVNSLLATVTGAAQDPDDPFQLTDMSAPLAACASKGISVQDVMLSSLSGIMTDMVSWCCLGRASQHLAGRAFEPCSRCRVQIAYA